MSQVGFEPMTPLFERAKTVDALDRAATVIGYHRYRPTNEARINFCTNSASLRGIASSFSRSYASDALQDCRLRPAYTCMYVHKPAYIRL
jgi:hypothetical protein